MRLVLAALALSSLAALAQPQPEGASGRQGQRDAAHATRFMVAAANPHAADAGLEILRAGGSALDAAIAVQMVLGLVEPQSSGIGGGAFLLHWSQRDKRLRSYDGRETAPAAAREPQAMASGAAVGVPGVLRMLEQAHRQHGRLPWARLFEPAIRLAEAGFAVSPRLNRLLEAESELRKVALYYPGGRALAVGARFANFEYANTLRAIAARGAAAFYGGPIAEDIVRAVRAHPSPGDMTLADLAGYRAVEREPVCLAYRAARVCSMGPPAGGVTVLQILGILERAGFNAAPPNSAHALHLFAEAGRLAYADRVRHVGDPRFIAVPVAGMLDPAYLESRSRLIGERSMGSAQPGHPRGASATLDSPESTRAATSHLVAVDERGDAISMTTTIESAFGSRILVRGFLLNNQLTDFTSREGAANRLEPGKRPLSAMSPAMVFKDGRLAMALGSPGGAPIINYVARTLLAMLDWKLDAQSAVALPNGGSLNGPTVLEAGSLYELLAPALRERGHDLRVIDLTSGVQAIERVPGGWRGGADPRREGVARGD
jgi:gamma-glutamyltranspeptidase/glutathione hydrolase